VEYLSHFTENPLSIVFATGFTASAGQVIFVRESFSVFSGNELVLGLLLGVWIASTATGSYYGQRFTIRNTGLFALSVLIAFCAGLYGLRAIRLFLHPGQSVSPVAIMFFLFVTESVPGFLGGFAFGCLSQKHVGSSVYRLENTGSIAGLLFVSILIQFGTPDFIIMGSSLLILLPYILTKKLISAVAMVTIAAFILFDPVSLQWKYPFAVNRIIYGREGEIVFSKNREITTLNNTLYRVEIPLPQLEQAVHIPILSHPNPRKVLVINNTGHLNELSKYSGFKVTNLESEPAFTETNSIIKSPETYKSSEKFDVILLGSGMPVSIGSSRFYSLSFFKHIHNLTSDSGIFSFTLPFNSSYLSETDRKLKSVIISTLKKEFKFVKIFPGEGYTFVASDKVFNFPSSCKIPTEYLESYILPSVTEQQIISANESPLISPVSTFDHPLVLTLGIQKYLDSFHLSQQIFIITILILFTMAIIFLFRRPAFLSIATSGFTTAVYSVIILILFQSCYGQLYSEISFLMIFLTAGFVAGSNIKKLPFSDLVISIYAPLSIGLLIVVTNPPLWQFLLFMFAMGLLGGAQFVSIKENRTGILNAADLMGGVGGMIVGPIFLIPVFGIVETVLLIFVIKLTADITGSKLNF
jgi:hypothetical protein